MPQALPHGPCMPSSSICLHEPPKIDCQRKGRTYYFFHLSQSGRPEEYFTMDGDAYRYEAFP